MTIELQPETYYWMRDRSKSDTWYVVWVTSDDDTLCVEGIGDYHHEVSRFDPTVVEFLPLRPPHDWMTGMSPAAAPPPEDDADDEDWTVGPIKVDPVEVAEFQKEVDATLRRIDEEQKNWIRRTEERIARERREKSLTYILGRKIKQWLGRT